MCDEAANVLDRLDGNIEIGELGLWESKPCVGLAHPVASAQVPGEQLTAFGWVSGFGFDCGFLRSVITRVVQRRVVLENASPKLVYMSCSSTGGIVATERAHNWILMLL